MRITTRVSLLASLLLVACESGAVGPVGQDALDAGEADQGILNPWEKPPPDGRPSPDVEELRLLPDTVAPADPCDDPAAGAFCAPCELDADCESGYCIWTPSGKVCTVTCVEECPLDWSCAVVGGSWPDVIHVCMPGFLFLCDPCTDDEDCNIVGLTSSGRCLSHGPAGSFCAEPCGSFGSCPKGLSCLPVADDGATDEYCLPDGECTCSDHAVKGALSTPCAVENDFGSCQGTRTCTENGLTACDAPVPAAESCNAIDDDCDGEVDEELGTVTCGTGTCQVEIPACVNGAMAACDPASLGTEEICNGKDDDCDGLVDEDLGTLTCGSGACIEQIQACVGGKPALCPETPPVGDPETCNGIDDDCDGVVDEEALDCGLLYADKDGDGSGDGADFACLCEPQGPYSALQPGDCNDTDATVHPGAQEVCNGKDDDCDGQTDEDLGSTPCGLGKCFHLQPNCANGVPMACNPYEGAGAEVCNGEDDDCDGQVDENLGTLTCGQGKCFHSVSPCLNGMPQLCDPFQGATPEICNGQDDDCDGQVDEGLGTLTCGQGACQVQVPACLNGMPQQCGNQGMPQPESCDGKDNDCDGQVDEANAIGCMKYHADKDGDGWGADSDFKCLCQADPVYKLLQGGDCYDQSKAVYPGNQAWYTTHRGDGLFDYNCDGIENYQFNDMFYCNAGCNYSSPGWYAYKPPCGQNGAFGIVCLYFMICDVTVETMPAACH